MKMPLILFLTFCLFIDNPVMAQTDFAPLGAEWYYGSTGTINDLHYCRYWVEKDTVIDGQSCQKISGTYVPVKGDSTATEPVFVYTTGDTVLYYNRAFSKFTPIFIYNVGKGDTLTFYFPHFTFPPGTTHHTDTFFHVTVDDVAMIDIDGLKLRQVWTSPFPLTFWEMGRSYIERIGSLFDLLPFYTSLMLPEDNERSLRCYKDADIAYQYTAFHCDYLPVKTNDINNFLSFVAIYPNPGKGDIVIKVNTENPS